MKRICSSCEKDYNSEGHTLGMDLSLCRDCNFKYPEKKFVQDQIIEIDTAIKDSSSKGEVMDLIQCKEVLKDELEEFK